MLEEDKWNLLDITVKNTVTGLHGIGMISGIGADNDISSEQIDHMADGHEIQKPVFVRFYLGTVRRILIYNIEDFFIKERFFIMFHTVFKEVISIILCHRGKLLTYKTDVFMFPVRLRDPVKENGKKFFEDDIHAIVFFALTIYESKGTFTGIVREKVKTFSCLIRLIIKKLLFHSLPCSHRDRKLDDISVIRVFKKQENIPVQTFPFNRMKIQRNCDPLGITVWFDAFSDKII